MKLRPEDRAKLLSRMKKEQGMLKCTPRESDHVATLVGALPLMRLVISWPLIKLNVPSDELEAPDDLTEMEQIWYGVEVDYEAVSAAARIPMTYVEQHVREAQLFGWVWPDGTVSDTALKLAKTTIARLAKGDRKGT